MSSKIYSLAYYEHRFSFSLPKIKTNINPFTLALDQYITIQSELSKGKCKFVKHSKSSCVYTHVKKIKSAHACVDFCEFALFVHKHFTNLQSILEDWAAEFRKLMWMFSFSSRKEVLQFTMVKHQVIIFENESSKLVFLEVLIIDTEHCK